MRRDLDRRANFREQRFIPEHMTVLGLVLVAHCDGCIFYRSEAVDAEIACFNDLKPDRQPAPDWTHRIM